MRLLINLDDSSLLIDPLVSPTLSVDELMVHHDLDAEYNNSLLNLSLDESMNLASYILVNKASDE